MDSIPWLYLETKKHLLTFPKVTAENIPALPSDLSRFLCHAFQDLNDDIPLGLLQALQQVSPFSTFHRLEDVTLGKGTLTNCEGT